MDKLFSQKEAGPASPASFRPASKRGEQSGQTLLIVVLVMVVGLTVGLSLASRSITSQKLATEDANAHQALSAAEAGVEKVLQSNNQTISSFSLGSSSIKSATANTVQGPQILLNGGNSVVADEGIDVWLVNHNSDGSINYASPWNSSVTFYWNSISNTCLSSSSQVAAMEFVVVSGSSASSAIIKRYAVDPCLAQRSSPNHFSAAATGSIILGQNFQYSYTISSITSGIFIRAIPLYASSVVAVTSSSSLPSQGSIINSVGVSGETQRKIIVYQGYPELASEFFPYILFSP